MGMSKINNGQVYERNSLTPISEKDSDRAGRSNVIEDTVFISVHYSNVKLIQKASTVYTVIGTSLVYDSYDVQLAAQ